MMMISAVFVVVDVVPVDKKKNACQLEVKGGKKIFSKGN